MTDRFSSTHRLFVVCAQDRNNWFIELSDWTAALIDRVEYDPSTWITTDDGFSYELVSKDLDNDVSANWGQSCSVFGTPGSDPGDRTNCHYMLVGLDFRSSDLEDECAVSTATHRELVVSESWENRIVVQCCNVQSGNFFASNKLPDCYAAVTYDEAYKVCADAQKRLCTRDEAKANTRYVQCGYGENHAWTSTPCSTSTSLPQLSARTPQLSVFERLSPARTTSSAEYSKAASDHDSTVVVSVDLSSRWVLGVAMVMAVLLLMNLWPLMCSGSEHTKRKYAKVVYADSEELTEDECEAIHA